MLFYQCTSNWLVTAVCLVHAHALLASFSDSIVQNEIHTVLCKNVSTKFTNVREQFAMIRDGSRTVHEPVLCISINGYKQSFECYTQLCEQVRELL